MDEAYVLFFSSNQVMWAADVLKGRKIFSKMVAVPRHLSSDCGYCLKINHVDIENVRDCLKKDAIEYSSIECCHLGMSRN